MLWHLEGSRICGWRCPFGQLCGKNNRELNRKKDGGDALTAGAWHLLDKKQHWDPLNTWEEAVVAANDGLTEGKREIDIVLDDNGNEVEPPTLWKKKKLTKWNFEMAEKACGLSYNPRGLLWDRRQHWLQHPIYHEAIAGRIGTILKHCRRQSWQRSIRFLSSCGARAWMVDLICGETFFSTMATNSWMCIKRTVGTCQHCHAFAKGAMDVFENSAAALKECKHTLERLRRN